MQTFGKSVNASLVDVLPHSHINLNKLAADITQVLLLYICTQPFSPLFPDCLHSPAQAWLVWTEQKSGRRFRTVIGLLPTQTEYITGVLITLTAGKSLNKSDNAYPPCIHIYCYLISASLTHHPQISHAASIHFILSDSAIWFWTTSNRMFDLRTDI